MTRVPRALDIGDGWYSQHPRQATCDANPWEAEADPRTTVDRHRVRAVVDVELERLAAAGDPDAPIPDDAIPFADHLAADGRTDLLPDWYMPSPMVGTPLLRGWRRVIAWIVVIGFLLIAASGLCNTYGVLEVA